MGEGFTPAGVGRWWAAHKEGEFPLASSKFRRICDSFQAMSSLPAALQGKALWGYLHAVSRRVEALEYHAEGPDGVAVSGRTSLCDAEDAAAAAVATEMCHEMLRMHRRLAERIAPSTVNVGALLEGHAVGQPGAAPAKLAKLFPPVPSAECAAAAAAHSAEGTGGKIIDRIISHDFARFSHDFARFHMIPVVAVLRPAQNDFA